MLKKQPKSEEEDTAFNLLQDSIIQNKMQHKPISLISDKAKKMYLQNTIKSSNFPEESIQMSFIQINQNLSLTCLLTIAP